MPATAMKQAHIFDLTTQSEGRLSFLFPPQGISKSSSIMQQGDQDLAQARRRLNIPLMASFTLRVQRLIQLTETQLYTHWIFQAYLR